MNAFTLFAARGHGGTARRGVGIGLLVLSALAMFAQDAAAAAPVGVKLLVQPWNPVTDDDSVQTVYDSNDAITDSLARTWDKVKPKLIDSIRARLLTPNLFAKGVSLYDLKTEVSAPELSVASDGSGGFVAKLLVRDAYIEAKSTTPDIVLGIGLGSYADPRCSVRFSLQLTLKLAVTEDKTRLLEARYGPNDSPVLVQGFKADSQNAVCDIAKFLASDAANLLLGRDLWEWMTNEINDPRRPEYLALNNTIKQELNAALAVVNAKMRAPAQYARLRVWVRNDKVTVLFGVRELPLPARTASARGSLVIGELRGLPLMITQCDQLRMTAMVKTGPAPLLNAFGTEFGKAPMVAVGALRGTALASPAAGQACDFAVDQLVPGFPHLLRFSYANPPHTVKSATRNPKIEYALSVRPVGWHFDKALHPQPLLTGMNLTLQAEDVGASAYLDKSRTAPYINRGDPADIKPGLLERTATQQSNPAFNATSALQPGLQRATKPSAQLPGMAGALTAPAASPKANAFASPLAQGHALPANFASLEDRAIIIVGGRPAKAGDVKRDVMGADDNAVLIVGGKSVRAAELKRALAGTAVSTGAAPQSITAMKGDAVALNPQPLPPDPQPDPKPAGAFKSSRMLVPR